MSIFLNISQFSKAVWIGKNIWRIINTIASIWGEILIMLGYLSLDIICSLKRTVFPRTTMLSENCSLLGTDNIRTYHTAVSQGMETTAFTNLIDWNHFDIESDLDFPMYTGISRPVMFCGEKRRKLNIKTIDSLFFILQYRKMSANQYKPVT